MDFAAAQESNLYGTTTITGHATALLGNKYGDIFNIQQATFLLRSTSVPETLNSPCKIVRQNRVLPGANCTLETVTTFDDGKILPNRGASQQVELRWYRREDLGAGVFGEVHREETHDGASVKNRAVKVLRRRQLEYMQIDYRKELDALIQLSHPQYVHRFVEFFSWYENEDNIYLAMEYVPLGDLAQRIRDGLKESDVRQIACQVLDGIRVMHRLDLVHRDIKPANIFVVQKDPIWWVKIGDFSISKSTITKQTSLHTQVGTQGYQAPETLGLVATGKGSRYSSQCDIWSFGCLVYELLVAQVPFADVGTLINYCNGRGQFPALHLTRAGATWMFTEFIQTLLQVDPQERPTADQAAFVLYWRCEAHTVRPDDREYLSFEDCLGRHFRFPWQTCSSWNDMRNNIRLALSYVEHVQNQVLDEEYDLVLNSGQVIDSEAWASIVGPGLQVAMRLHPEAESAPILVPSNDTAVRPTSAAANCKKEDNGRYVSNPSNVAPEVVLPASSTGSDSTVAAGDQHVDILIHQTEGRSAELGVLPSFGRTEKTKHLRKSFNLSEDKELDNRSSLTNILTAVAGGLAVATAVANRRTQKDDSEGSDPNGRADRRRYHILRDHVRDQKHEGDAHSERHKRRSDGRERRQDSSGSDTPEDDANRNRPQFRTRRRLEVQDGYGSERDRTPAATPLPQLDRRQPQDSDPSNYRNERDLVTESAQQDSLTNNEGRTVLAGDGEDGRVRNVSIVEPIKDQRLEFKPKGILKPPRTMPFPEDPNPTREGIAPLNQSGKDGIPPGARWTKVSRILVNPEALEKANERYEERENYVIVLRVLSREEIGKLAEMTRKIRGNFALLYLQIMTTVLTITCRSPRT